MSLIKKSGPNKSDPTMLRKLDERVKQEQAVRNSTRSTTPANKKTTSADSAYSDAVKTLKSSGVSDAAASGIMTRNEWRRRKKSSGYDTYEDYLDSVIQLAQPVELSVEVDGGAQKFGKLTLGGYKAIEGNTLDRYVPKNEEEANTIAKYTKFVEDRKPYYQKNRLEELKTHTDDYWQNRFETLTAELAEKNKGKAAYRPAAEALVIVKEEKEKEDAELRSLERLVKLNKYTTEITSKSDFEQNSKYSPRKPKTDEELKAEGYKQRANGEWWKQNLFTGAVDTYRGEDSDLYIYINDEGERFGIGTEQKTATPYSINMYETLGYHTLTQEEIGAFNYLYNQDRINGTDTAGEYLRNIAPLLEQRVMEIEAGNYKELSKEAPVFMSAVSLGTNLANALMFPAKVTTTAMGGDAPILDMYGNRTQAIRGAVSEDMGTVGKLMYNGVMSIGDMGTAMLASAGNAKFMQAIMSSSAGSSTISEAKKNGASDGKALAMGLGSAAIEWATEKYSIEEILKKPESILGFLVTNTVTEGTEEGVSNIANTALDAIVSEIFGERNEIEQLVDYLMLYEGKTEEEALKIAFNDKLKSLGEDVLVGGLTGFGMAGGKVSPIVVQRGIDGIRNRFSNDTIQVDNGENLVNSQNEDVKFSIKRTTDNKPVVNVEKNILENVPENEWAKTVKEHIKKYSSGIPVSGRLIKVNQKTSREYINSKDSQKLKRTDTEKYTDKLKAAGQLDEIVLASTNYINEDLNHERKDNIKEFARGEVLIQVDGKKYNANVIVGLTKGDNMLLYDVTDIKEAEFEIKRDSSSTKKIQNNAHLDRQKPSSIDTIPQGSNGVNSYSMQDGGNNALQAQEGVSQSSADIASSYGARGKAAFEEIMAENNWTPEQTKRRFQSAYELGLTEAPRRKVRLIDTIQETAYNAGRQDAILSMKKEKTKGATIWGKNGGLVENDYTKSLDNRTFDTLNKIGRATGTKIIFENIPVEENSDGYYRDSDGTIHIDINTDKPVMTVVKHELTHRLQTLAPREYRAFRNYAVSVMNGNSPYGHTATEAQRLDYLAKSDGEINLNTEEAMDELAANFTERILTDEKALNDFVNHITSSAENMTMGQKFFQVVREFIDKVKAVFNGDRSKMDAAAQKEFGATISRLEKAERLWKNAYAAAAKRVQKSGTSQNTLENNSKEGYNGDIKHALKKWRTDLNKTQLEEVEKRLRQAGNPEETRITDTANWYKGRINGEDLFVIYSTEDANNPTILYEVKGKNAKVELDILMDLLEGEENGKSTNGKPSFAQRVSKGNWVQNVNSSQGNLRHVGNGRNNQNAGVLQGQSQRNGSRAFRNVLENLFGISNRVHGRQGGGLNEGKRHSLKEKKVAEVNRNGIKQNRESFENDRRHNKVQTQGATGSFQKRDTEGLHQFGQTRQKNSGSVETRTIENVVDTDEFQQLAHSVGNELSSTMLDELLEKYSDNEMTDAYDFSEVVAYDMLSDAGNELRALFADSIDEYFNDNTSADVDATGRSIDKGIINKLLKSIVRNRKGQLIPVYHGTDKVHSTLKAGDIGIHFGSYNQATQRAIDKEIANPVYIKAYLNITKPLIINRDGYNWNAPQVAMYLADAGLITSEQAQSFIDRGISAETNQELSDMIQDMGYDGIIYTNAYEAGAGKSYIVFDDSQVVRIDDAKHSLKGEGDLVKDYEKLKSGQISSEEYEQLLERYGSISPGEKPYREARVPKKTADGRKVSRTVRTILEAKATPDEAIPSIEKMVTDGDFSYDVYSDKKAIADANATIEKKGFATALSDWASDTEKGKVSKESTALGWALYNNAANSGDIKTAMTVLNKMVQHQRSAAQALQATRILKKLSPEGQLYGEQRSVESLQEELIDKYGDKAPELKIDEELAEQFLTAETQEERDAIAQEIYKDIGSQMPSRFIDKWNAWRYLAMLGNARTHIRNIVGNATFAPVVITKDLTATAIESVVSRVSGKKTVRGKAIITGNKSDRALLKAAWSDYGNVADMISNGGKYNDAAMANQQIEEGRQIFKIKPLEWARKKNSQLLEAEDMWFSKPHYAYALAQYCKANNITAEQIERGKAIAPAREYAIKEAQKATYRDTNAFSQFISELGRSGNKKTFVTKSASVALEGILPFRKTPANILVRGVEYSPLGLLKGFSYDLVQVSKGKISATEAIDNISAGLTGTGLLALGIYLAAQGLIRGHGEEDKDEKEFKELMGHQSYALELPNGQSITLDWLAPEALPFFVGVNIWEATKGSEEEVNLSTILQSVTHITEPMLEMSCLQGLNDLVEGMGYASSNDTSGLVALLSSAATSYLTQGIPTLLGQTERTGEENRMTTYTEKNDFLTSDAQYTLGKASAKIPFWDYNQIPYVDAWGRKEASGTALKRGLNNFLNPAYTSTVDESKMEKELLRLYEATGEGGVFPERADKYFTVDGKRKDLTGEEYVRYATLKGQKSYKLVSDLVKSDAYKKLSNEEKVKAVKEAYDYANQKAKQAISNYKPDTWVQKADEFGSNVGSYISFKTEVSGTKEDNGGKISKQEVAGIVLDMAQNDSDTWKMYLSMYDSDSDLYAYNNGVDGEDYMRFLEALAEVDAPTKSGKYGTYTQAEATKAVNSLEGLTREEKSALWQSVNTTWKKNPF